MKNKIVKKKRSAFTKDAFFETADTKRRRKTEDDDYNIDSSEGVSDDEDRQGGGPAEVEEVEETAAEIRKRIAEESVKKVRAMAKELEEDGGEYDDESGDEKDRRNVDRDSRVAGMFQQQQLEDSGRVRRLIASRVQKPEATDGFRVLVKHRQSVTAVALSEDDFKGFSASKDGSIVQWDVDSGKREEYAWPSEKDLKSHGARDPEGRVTKHSRVVLALAVSSDGRYLASGGFDRHVHLWDTRTRKHIQAFHGHRGTVSCLTFRQGTSELFSGSYDRLIKTWNAEDRCFIDTLHGHQSDVLTIDSLRKERVLTVGRDRTMHLWKVPDRKHMVFRAPASSLECCCFINNDEFLSGSNDGSIEHWTVLRKKPLHIIKNAHALSTLNNSAQGQNDNLSNGSTESSQRNSENLCSSVHSWVSSVTVCRNSDLAASGAGNGSVRLWEIESDSKGIRPLFELPLVGFVNSLAFAKSGEFLVAGVGKEPRLGRWGRLPGARHGVAVHSLRLS